MLSYKHEDGEKVEDKHRNQEYEQGIENYTNMTEMDPTTPVITLNVNGPNLPM